MAFDRFNAVTEDGGIPSGPILQDHGPETFPSHYRRKCAHIPMTVVNLQGYSASQDYDGATIKSGHITRDKVKRGDSYTVTNEGK